jgi:hypothetical protein
MFYINIISYTKKLAFGKAYDIICHGEIGFV